MGRVDMILKENQELRKNLQKLHQVLKDIHEKHPGYVDHPDDYLATPQGHSHIYGVKDGEIGEKFIYVCMDCGHVKG